MAAAAVDDLNIAPDYATKICTIFSQLIAFTPASMTPEEYYEKFTTLIDGRDAASSYLNDLRIL